MELGKPGDEEWLLGRRGESEVQPIKHAVGVYLSQRKTCRDMGLLLSALYEKRSLGLGRTSLTVSGSTEPPKRAFIITGSLYRNISILVRLS